MKRHGNLFPSITSFSALYHASRKARKGKRYRRAVQVFEYNLESNLLKLQSELQSGEYRPGPYHEFHIYEPKNRKISAAPYRDRVVHHALNTVIEPIFDRSFIHDNYACRLNKGVHAAVDRFTHFSRRYPYVLKCDVRKYFPSIDHAILKEKIRRKIKCRPTLDLIDRIIDSSNPQEDAHFLFPGDDPMTPWFRPKGIPIGNLSSQLFANLYLSAADHFIRQNFPECGYLRYMDDLTAFADNKETLWQIAAALESFLAKDRLKLHQNKRMVYPVHIGVNYLGYKSFPNYRRLKTGNADRYRRRLRTLQKQYHIGKIDLDDVRASVHSWIGHVGHACTKGLRRSVLGKAPFQRDGAQAPFACCGAAPGTTTQGTAARPTATTTIPTTATTTLGFG